MSLLEVEGLRVRLPTSRGLTAKRRTVTPPCVSAPDGSTFCQVWWSRAQVVKTSTSKRSANRSAKPLASVSAPPTISAP